MKHTHNNRRKFGVEETRKILKKERMNNPQKQILLPSIIAMILLFIAIFPIKEYGYYILLRWVICLTSVYTVYFSYKTERIYWIWIMGVVAVIFNPIIPLHLGKEIWRFVDFFVALIFLISIFVFKGPDAK